MYLNVAGNGSIHENRVLDQLHLAASFSCRVQFNSLMFRPDLRIIQNTSAVPYTAALVIRASPGKPGEIPPKRVGGEDFSYFCTGNAKDEERKISETCKT